MHLAEMVFEDKVGRSIAGGNIELAKDRAQVSIDGARADDQDFSDLRIGEALRH